MQFVERTRDGFTLILLDFILNLIVRHGTLSWSPVKEQSPTDMCDNKTTTTTTDHNNIPLPTLTPRIPCPDSDRCEFLALILTVVIPIETVGPCHQQVLSDPRMVVLRQKRHTCTQEVFRLSQPKLSWSV